MRAKRGAALELFDIKIIQDRKRPITNGVLNNT